MSQAETRSPPAGGNVLARRYAGALFELASEQNQLDAVAADLRLLKTLLQESPEFDYLATAPRVALVDLMTAMQQIATTAKLHTLSGNFLKLVAQSRRLPHLDAMIDAFLGQLAMHRGELTADVRVAHALTEAQREKLTAQLRQLADTNKIQLIVQEDPSLLGGLTVKLGSYLIDASVKTKLARLERQLKTQEEAA